RPGPAGAIIPEQIEGGMVEMRRLVPMALMSGVVLLAACGNSNPAPPTTSTTGATTAATTAPTTAATTGATTGPRAAATTGATTTGATSGGGSSAACAALDRLDAAFKALVPDVNEIAAAAAHLIQISGTLSDQGQ